VSSRCCTWTSHTVLHHHTYLRRLHPYERSHPRGGWDVEDHEPLPEQTSRQKVAPGRKKDQEVWGGDYLGGPGQASKQEVESWSLYQIQATDRLAMTVGGGQESKYIF
jgi:hypothetical protein